VLQVRRDKYLASRKSSLTETIRFPPQGVGLSLLFHIQLEACLPYIAVDSYGMINQGSLSRPLTIPGRP